MSRWIKRYRNRKLYDVSTSRYVTLEEIGVMVRAGETVRVTDHEPEVDITSQVLAKILLEDERLSPAMMHTLVRLGAVDADIRLDEYEELASRIAQLEQLIAERFVES